LEYVATVAGHLGKEEQEQLRVLLKTLGVGVQEHDLS
jgi:hypothetical protein